MRLYLGVASLCVASLTSPARGADDVPQRFSGEFRKMKDEEIAQQRQARADLMQAVYRTSGAPRTRVAQLLTLAELHLADEPEASLQFLFQAEAANAKAPNAQTQNAIRYLRAKAYLELGRNRDSLAELARMSNRDFSFDFHKSVSELELRNLASLGEVDEYLAKFDAYSRRHARHTWDDDLALLAAESLTTPDRRKDRFRLLEGLAEKYPLTDASRRAFAMLQDEACEQADRPAYHFSVAFLRTVNWQSSLDPGLDAWVTEMTRQPLVQASGEVRRLTAREEIELLSRLKKLPRMLTRIAEAEARGGLSEDDASLYAYLRARALLIQSDFRGTMVAADAFVARFPRSWRAQLVKGFKAQALGKLGYHAQSAALFAELAQKTGKGNVRWQAFWHAYQAKDYKTALDMLGRHALAILPDGERSALDYWRARLLEKLGRQKEAQSLLAGISSRYPLSHYTAATMRPPGLGTLALAAETPPTVEVEAVVDEAGDEDEMPRRVAAAGSNVNLEFTSATKVFLQNTTQTGVAEFRKDVEKYAGLVGLDSGILLSVMKAESNFNKNALSPVGALGLMQLMPFTAVRIAKELEDEAYDHRELLNPRYNIFYGAYYFRRLVDYYDGNFVIAIAAYNAGPTAVNGWIESCRECRVDEFVDAIPYKETRRYVKRILRYYMQYKDQAAGDIANALASQLPRGFAQLASMY